VPLFSDLPQAVLAAIIIDAVVFGMIDLAELPCALSFSISRASTSSTPRERRS
jgi:hypothetical protein